MKTRKDKKEIKDNSELINAISKLDKFGKFPSMPLEPIIEKPASHKNISLATKRMFEEMNYIVYPRKKLGNFFADLICIRNCNDVIAVEVKPLNINEIRKGIGQLYTYVDWVHQTYLVVPMETYKTPLYVEKLLMNTPFGLIYYLGHGDKSYFGIPAKNSYPDMIKLYDLIRRTSGYCWICGRTFVEVLPPEDKFLKRIGFKKREKVKICVVCSKVMVNIVAHIGEEFFEKKKNHSEK